MISILEIILLSLAIVQSMRAPSISKIYSPNGQYYCEKIPGRYFKDSTEHYCKGSLYEVSESEKDELLWSRFLTNKNSPHRIIVSNDGHYVITIGNWYSRAGGDNVVVIYGPNGDIIEKYSIADIAPGNDIVERVQKGGHNMYWGGQHLVDEEHAVLILKVIEDYKATISDVQIHYEVGIELATGKFINIDSILGNRLSEEEKADIYDQTLELAVAKKKIPFYKWIKYDVTQSQDTIRIISSDNIEPWLIPNCALHLLCLEPKKIQQRAEQDGNFLFLYFEHPPDLVDSIVHVRISSAWAKHKESTIDHDSEGGLWIQFHKRNGRWLIKEHISVILTSMKTIEDLINDR